MIQRQVLELDLPSSRSAPQIQEAAADLFRDPHPLQQVFDRLAGGDEVLRVERLEVDLGLLSGPDWRRLLLERLAKLIEESLQGEAAASATIGGEQTVSRQGAGDVHFRQFAFFLVHGRLPWWGDRPRDSWSELEPEALDSVQWKSLAGVLRSHTRARRRLILCAANDFLERAVEVLGGLTASATVLKQLTPDPLPGPAGNWRDRFWTTVLDCAAGGAIRLERGRAMMRQLLLQRTTSFGMDRRRRSGEPGDQATPVDVPPAASSAVARPGQAEQVEPAAEEGEYPALEIPDLPPPWQRWLTSEVLLLRREIGRSRATSPTSQPSVRAPSAADGSTPTFGSSAEGGPGASSAAPNEKTARLAGDGPPPAVRPFDGLHEEEESIYLEGAGVVILHPFLSELLRVRGLVSDGQFGDEACRFHAVRLLSYLAFGEEDTPEYDLLLPKLLCGLPWEEPLPRGRLEEEDREACRELLLAVLKHWNALGSSSPDWLRHHFLLRQGKLEPVDPGWKLTVERRAQDVLLDKLPWGLGVIRLPWMPAFLHVSWTD